MLTAVAQPELADDHQEPSDAKEHKPSVAAHLLRHLKRAGQHRGALGLLFQSRMEILIRAVELENEVENHRVRAAQFGVIFREYREVTKIITEWQRHDEWTRRPHPADGFLNALSSQEKPELVDLNGYYWVPDETDDKAGDGETAGPTNTPGEQIPGNEARAEAAPSGKETPKRSPVEDAAGNAGTGDPREETHAYHELPPRWRAALEQAPRPVRRRVKRLLEKNRYEPSGRCHREIEALLGPAE